MLGGDQTRGFIHAGQAHNQLSYFPGLQLIYIYFLSVKGSQRGNSIFLRI